MVKRYEPRSMCDLPAHEEMREVDFGDYVTFEDYEKCRGQLLSMTRYAKGLVESSKAVVEQFKDFPQLSLKPENFIYALEYLEAVRKEFSEETE